MFYSRLTSTVKKRFLRGEYFSEDYDRFYALMFNNWKNSVLTMTQKEFGELYKNGRYGADFIKMREYLKKIPDLKTKKDADAILSGTYDDKELEAAISKYKWNCIDEHSSWVHVRSKYVTAKKHKTPKIEHRLYLNTESVDAYKMITYFVEKCNKYSMPYYFKFDEFGNRDDNIIIYSSTADLTKYIEILKEIEMEHPELIARAKDPPILTGKIERWIGYGSEPTEGPNGELRSFNGVRAKSIEPIIDKQTKSWLMKNRYQRISYQGHNFSYQNYVALKSTEEFIAKLERDFNYWEKVHKNEAETKKIPYNQAKVTEKLGYDRQEIKENEFKKTVYDFLSRNIENLLINICSGNAGNLEPITMKFKNGAKSYFYIFELENLVRKMAKEIVGIDPDFASSLQKEIKNDARKQGIDPNKYCFDLHTREMMRIHYEQNKNNKNEHQTLGSLKTANVHTITENIDPILMAKKIVLPNGVQIPARQYIQEVVFPQLPQSGVVVLANGSLVNIKQFIEEHVMGECLNDYNGNFAKYMFEKTRSNMGVISLDYYNEKYKINPVEITKYIGAHFLDKRVTLPNGVDISFRQCVEELFAPHIPDNGKIMLKNGAVIPITQYIEEVLIFEIDKKEYRDINQLLFNTTIKNKGEVFILSKQNVETISQNFTQKRKLEQQPTL